MIATRYRAWRRSISNAYRLRKNIVLEIMPAVDLLSNRKIDEGQAMNDLVAGFLKFRETGYQERTELRSAFLDRPRRKIGRHPQLLQSIRREAETGGLLRVDYGPGDSRSAI